MDKLSTPSRDYAISVIRAISTMFIITCHILQYFGLELAYWFNVGVEIFLVVSGFLYGKRVIADGFVFISKNLKKILIPFLTWTFIAIILFIVLARESVSVISILNALVYGPTVPGLTHLWFIPYILFCYLITPYLQKSVENSSLKKIFFIVFICFVVSYWQYEFRRIVCYVVGYIIGARIREGKFNFIKVSLIFTVLAVVLTAIRVYFKYIGSPSMWGKAGFLFTAFDGYSHSVLGIALFLIFYMVLSKLKIKNNAFIRFTDKYSFEIYLTHQVFILNTLSVLSATELIWLNILLAIALSIISAIILKLICQKLMNIQFKRSNL